MLNTTEPPVDDIRVRQALEYAVILRAWRHQMVLDDDAAAEQRAKLQSDDRDDRDQRVPQGVPHQEDPIRQALGAGRRDVRLGERLAGLSECRSGGGLGGPRREW